MRCLTCDLDNRHFVDQCLSITAMLAMLVLHPEKEIQLARPEHRGSINIAKCMLRQGKVTELTGDSTLTHKTGHEPNARHTSRRFTTVVTTDFATLLISLAEMNVTVNLKQPILHQVSKDCGINIPY